MENYNQTSNQGNRFFDEEQAKKNINDPNNAQNGDEGLEDENPTHPFREENDEIEQEEVNEDADLNLPSSDETEVDENDVENIGDEDEELLEDEEDFDLVEEDDVDDDSLEEK